jgi:hypothetical protein
MKLRKLAVTSGKLALAGLRLAKIELKAGADLRRRVMAGEVDVIHFFPALAWTGIKANGFRGSPSKGMIPGENQSLFGKGDMISCTLPSPLAHKWREMVREKALDGRVWAVSFKTKPIAFTWATGGGSVDRPTMLQAVPGPDVLVSCEEANKALREGRATLWVDHPGWAGCSVGVGEIGDLLTYAAKTQLDLNAQIQSAKAFVTVSKIAYEETLFVMRTGEIRLPPLLVRLRANYAARQLAGWADEEVALKALPAPPEPAEGARTFAQACKDLDDVVARILAMP